jgi:hypothetical protein
MDIAMIGLPVIRFITPATTMALNTLSIITTTYNLLVDAFLNLILDAKAFFDLF